jgi:hypothetical protein
MMRPFSMPQVPAARLIPFRRLNFRFHFLSSGRIRIPLRLGFSPLGRTGQKNKHDNKQDMERCLDVHRRLPPRGAN